MLVNAISLKPFPQSTSNLKFVFILIIGQMLLILGHLLKPRWLPSLFKKVIIVYGVNMIPQALFISLTDSYFEISSYVIKKTNGIDIGLIR